MQDQEKGVSEGTVLELLVSVFCKKGMGLLELICWRDPEITSTSYPKTSFGTLNPEKLKRLGWNVSSLSRGISVVQ